MFAIDGALPNTSVSASEFVRTRVAVVSYDQSPQLYWPPAQRPAPIAAEALISDQLLDEIAALPRNWDGYGAPAMTGEICATAKAAVSGLLRHVPLPEITPNSNDTISLEWEATRGVAHLEIGTEQFSFFLKAHGGVPVYLQGAIQELSPDGLGQIIHQRLFTIAIKSVFVSDFRFDADVQFG